MTDWPCPRRRKRWLTGAMRMVLNQEMANQRLKLTGAAILVFRASTSLQAATTVERVR
jgi:hypothetical protein